MQVHRQPEARALVLPGEVDFQHRQSISHENSLRQGPHILRDLQIQNLFQNCKGPNVQI